VAEEIVGRWPDRQLTIAGAGNAEAAGDVDVVVVATPWESATHTVREIEALLRGKVVVSVANALVREGKDMLAVIPPRGSVAACVAAALPQSLVAGAGDLDRTLTSDVLVCSDHEEATAVTMDLMGRIAGLRPLDAGGLASASAVEAFTAVLVGLNIRYKAQSTLGLFGLDGNARVPERTPSP
jgi:NADPH-dependent F420 reductase